MTGRRAPAGCCRRVCGALGSAIPSANPVSTTLLIFLVFAGGAYGAGTGASTYNEANALYRQGEFRKAAGRYEEVVSRGVRNGYVFFNLGNAYFKAGETGRAILAYERALRLMPDDEDVLANLRFVNAVKEDKSPDEDLNLATRILSSGYRLLSADVLAVSGSVCLFLLAAAAVIRLLSASRRSLWIGLLVLAGMGFCGSGALLTYRVYAESSVSEAIVIADEVRGRSGPGDDYLLVFTIHEGTKVTIERMEDRWYLVRLPNGIGGWLPGAAMEII
ncbi:MAG: tetratricopeptide repeat protein [Gemmatimonadota bacterium]|nr:tetratricopeptide repeat protein [Gemmatimonadota bacterium]